MRTFGPTNAFMAVVVKRSNSRNCGDTDEDVVAKQAGYSSRTISMARASCEASRYEKRKQMAMASTPASLSSRTACLTPSSSRGSSTSPRGGTSRSVTVLRWRRFTSGRSCQGMSCMME